jgi:hypothetical protein
VIAMLHLVAIAGLAASAKRRLSFEAIAGYEPGSNVVDHNALDRDQKAMEMAMSNGFLTGNDFDLAKQIYEEGGNSKSYALVTVANPIGVALTKGQIVTVKDASGTDVTTAKIYSDAEASATTFKVQYPTFDVQSSYVNCRVGALPNDAANQAGMSNFGSFTTGCWSSGYQFVTADNEVLTSTALVNKNGRTLQGFSLQAEAKMWRYQDFQAFKAYYGDGNYADKWVTAAFDMTNTGFTSGRGDADFSAVNDVSTRKECVKKGTAYMNVWMYVVREFEDAIDDCQVGDIGFNDDSHNSGPVHAWDEGVAFYAGSLEGYDGSGSGVMPYALADKRCANYRTCGQVGYELDGTSRVNYELFDLFEIGKVQLQMGYCDVIPPIVRQIVKWMTVPLIQGTLRYAYKVDYMGGAEKEKAEGAVFAAAVLPRVHYCSPSAAATIYSNMKIGAESTNFEEVKNAFEEVYGCLEITCDMIGGLWDSSSDDYYELFTPCTYKAAPPPPPSMTC